MHDALPKLKTATSFIGKDCTVEREYKSGARFHGEITDDKKSGHGTFEWPDGGKYVGDYRDNVRCGQGTQYWPDGSKYTGEFVADLRHGKGEHEWINGETYTGDFYLDRRNGIGRYTWPDGNVYDGPFYVDKKQGYGQFHFPDGRVFQGLYKDDEREGPGVLTYPSGQQDVGLWRRERLVKLCSEVNDCFSIKNFPDLDGKEYHVPLAEENDRPKSRAKSPFDYDDVPEDGVILSRESGTLKSESLDARSAALDHDEFSTNYFQSLTKTREPVEELYAWNNTPTLVKMQKHILRHQQYETSLFSVDDVVKGDRSCFGEKGPVEEMSEALIEAAGDGDMEKVLNLLNQAGVDPNVADRRGRTPLLGAAISWNLDMINCLLDHGAAVNQVTDEGVSALSACCVYFYPSNRFKKNSAEHQMTSLKRDESKSCKIDRKMDVIPDDELMTRKISPLNVEEKQSSTSLQACNQSGDVVKTQSRENDVTINDADGADSQGSDFASNASLRNFNINVTDELMERCATQLSQNKMVTERSRLLGGDADATVCNMAVRKYEYALMQKTLTLLLKRGASPNASRVPMPVLYFAVKAGDVEMARQLLMKRASTRLQLPKERGGLFPLHIAVAIPGDEGVLLTELLLNSLADPDARADPDDSYISKAVPEEVWNRDPISEQSKALLGGRAPLHIACSRDDDYKRSAKIVHLLLDHHANPNLLCNGHSPLSLAIASGNDLVIDELLSYGADPSLILTHGVGSALCAASSTEHQARRTIDGRIKLIDKLMMAGANILAPVAIGAKRVMGTAVDYAYYMYNLDRRIAHVPYHALSPTERDTFNERKQLLAHMGSLLREKVVERERERLEMEERLGMTSRPASANFIFTGAGMRVSTASRGKGGVSFLPGTTSGRPDSSNDITRRILFKYCYECGRSVNVRLTACTRCKEVYYCSKACKLKAWTSRHKDECIRIGGRSPSPGKAKAAVGRRVDSPTPATDLENRQPTTVKSLMADVNSMRNLNPMKGRSRSLKPTEGANEGLDKITADGRKLRTRQSDTNRPDKKFRKGQSTSDMNLRITTTGRMQSESENADLHIDNYSFN